MPLPAAVRVAVLDDYDVIVEGATALLRSHNDLIEVVACDMVGRPVSPVDVALIDCFAVGAAGASLIADVSAHPNVDKVAVYTWGNAPEVIEAALAFGAHAVLSKGLSGQDLAEALVAAHRGERVVRVGTKAPAAAQPDGREAEGRMWPGKAAGLTERESEVLALITQGKSTADIGRALYLSVNSIKTHTRTLFRKIGVNNRTEAALWGVDHGFRPDRSTGAAEPW